MSFFFKSPDTVRIGNKSIFVRSEMWRHNVRHLKRGDLDSNLGSMAYTFKNDNRLNKPKATVLEVN